MEITESKKEMYFPAVNFLRGIAALMVACYHFSNFSDMGTTLLPTNNIIFRMGNFGNQGVIVFFVISGFVIPMSMLKGNYTFEKAGRFLLKRSVRIEPPYIASILLIFLTGYYYLIKDHSPYSIDIQQFIYHIFYVIPFTHHGWYNIIFWTLALEIQYYLFMSIIYPALVSENRFIKYASILLLSGSCFLISDDRFVTHFLCIFSIGVLLFLYYSGKLNVYEWLVFTAFAATAIYVKHHPETLIAAVFAAAFIHFVKLDHPLTNRFGEISYSLYLTHGLVGNKILYFLYKNSEALSYRYLLIGAALLSSLLFALIFWWLVERPSSALSKKIKLTS